MKKETYMARRKNKNNNQHEWSIVNKNKTAMNNQLIFMCSKKPNKTINLFVLSLSEKKRVLMRSANSGSATTGRRSIIRSYLLVPVPGMV